jgi:hypothetical protein
VIGSKGITLIDTPGFDDSVLSDLEILKMLADWLKKDCEKGQLLTGIIYLHPITKTRIEGSTRRVMSIIKKLCGEDNMKNVVLTTTFWNDIPEELGARREKEMVESDDFWKTMVENGSKVKRMSRDYDQFKPILLEIAGAPTMKLQIQKEMEEGKALEDTMAGLFINDDMRDLDATHRAEAGKLDEWWKGYFAETERKAKEAAKERKAKEDKEIARLNGKKKREEQREKSRLDAIFQLQERDRLTKQAEFDQMLKKAAERQARKDREIAEEAERAARTRRQYAAQAAHNDSLLQQQSVESDIDIFRTAYAVGMTRISVAGFEAEGVGMGLVNDPSQPSVDRSAINLWCDRCRKPLGARWYAGTSQPPKHHRYGSLPNADICSVRDLPLGPRRPHHLLRLLQPREFQSLYERGPSDLPLLRLHRGEMQAGKWLCRWRYL